MISQLKHQIRKLVTPFAAQIAPTKWKEFNELRYWKKVKASEGELSNKHYVHFYTTHFGLTENDFTDKVILDLGCGPRGSLEWANTAKRRIGLDPLANEYLKLGASAHQMEYINSPSERMPLGDGECDAVFSFNSLDHVSDIDQTVSEIKRITKENGVFLLLVEVNHPPTDCEPHFLTPQAVIDMFKPEFECQNLVVYKPVSNGIYKSILADKNVSDPTSTTEIGYLSARFNKTR